MSGKPWVIYTLSDPRYPDRVRYVGKTVRKPEHRLQGHLHYSKKSVHTHLTCWLRSLISAGVTPSINVVEKGGPESDWIEAECRWIRHYRILGELVNSTAGGEGKLGAPVSPETIAKIAAANRGRKASPETRLKQSLAKLGKKPKMKPDSYLKAAVTRSARIASGELVLPPRSTSTIEKNAAACRATWERKRAEGWTVPDNWSRFRPDNRGVPCSAEKKKKIGDANRGRIMSEEARRKMSEAKLGKAPHNKGLDFHEAKRIVNSLGVRDLKHHRELHDAGMLPSGVPKNPQLSYRQHPDWRGQRVFFNQS